MNYIKKSIVKNVKKIISCDEIINNCNNDINNILSLIDGYVLNNPLDIKIIGDAYQLIEENKKIRDHKIIEKNKNIDKIHSYINKYNLPFNNYKEVLNHENI